MVYSLEQLLEEQEGQQFPIVFLILGIMREGLIVIKIVKNQALGEK